MIQHEVNRQQESASTEKRLIRKNGHLHIDVPVRSFQAVFVNFNDAAEGFAMSLTDRLHRKFAYQYVEYLQDIARGWKPTRPYTTGRPNCRLIGSELERLFSSCFFRPDQVESFLG